MSVFRGQCSGRALT